MALDLGVPKCRQRPAWRRTRQTRWQCAFAGGLLAVCLQRQLYVSTDEHSSAFFAAGCGPFRVAAACSDWRRRRTSLRQQVSEATVGQNAENALLTALLHESLSVEQKDIIAQPATGVYRVMACPGSGKTAVVTMRVGHLIDEHRVDPRQVMCVTFTNQAARELKDRLKSHIGKEAAGQVVAGTFHSIASRIIRAHVKYLQPSGNTNTALTNSFVVFDEEDQLSTLKREMKKAAWKTGGVDAKAAKQVIMLMNLMRDAVPDSWALSGQALIKAYKTSKAGCKHPLLDRPWMPGLLDDLWLALRRQNALNFGDLLSAAVALLRHPTVGRRCRERWQHIFVDEAQDTCSVQYTMVQLLATPDDGGSLMLVGDFDQSIYSWRGAEPMLLADTMPVTFPKMRTLPMSTNYRSTQRLVTFASALLSKMRRPSYLKLRHAAHQELGEPVKVFAASSEGAEAQAIAEEVRRLHSEQPNMSMAVLYRMRKQARGLEPQLLARNVSYKLVGGIPFFARTEVKDILAYLRLAANSADDTAFVRVVNVPKRKIGDVALGKLDKTPGQSLWEKLDTDIASGGRVVKGPARQGFHNFHAVISELTGMLEQNATVLELITAVLDSTNYRAYLKQTYGDETETATDDQPTVQDATAPEPELDEDDEGWGERWQNLLALQELAASWAGDTLGRAALAAFLESAQIDPSASAAGRGASAVTLMTMHSAKGTEYDAVFLHGITRGILPLAGIFEMNELEEEKRLLYVAATRARRRLYISYTLGPSPFLDGIVGGILDGKRQQPRMQEWTRLDVPQGRREVQRPA